MADYLIEAYNADMSAIQDREARALAGALEIYVTATRTITDPRQPQRRADAAARARASIN